MAAVQEPEALLCPIMWLMMRDPVVNLLGNTYEREAIERAWASQSGQRKRDPLTNTRLASNTLVPNQSMRRQVRAAQSAKRALRASAHAAASD
jgi:hypothetical protein